MRRKVLNKGSHGPISVTYTATLDVKRSTAEHLARLLRDHRTVVKTRRGRRVLSCFKQSVVILRWFLDGTRLSQLARDNGLSTSTAYRYLHEGLTVLASGAPDLATALERAKAAGLTHLNLDGTVIRTDRVAAPGPNGADLWWSGKHKHHGGNMQVIATPDGCPIWVSLCVSWPRPPTSTSARKNTAASPLPPGTREKITALAADFPRLWNDPATPMRERKRMVRLLLTDVTLTKTDHIRRRRPARRPRPPAHAAPPAELLGTAADRPRRRGRPGRAAGRAHTDAQTAELLNERNLTSGTGSPFTPGIVVHLRNAYRLRIHRQRLLDSGLLTVCELARHLDVHFQTVKHWRRDGIITGVLANDKGEYLYPLPGPDLVRPIIGRPRKSVLDPDHCATTR